MTPEQTAAIINASVARAMISAMGMHAENQHRINQGEQIAYRDEAFLT